MRYIIWTIIYTKLYIVLKGQRSFVGDDASDELDKLGDLVRGTAEASDNSGTLSNLKVDALGDSPTEEPSQESSSGEVYTTGKVQLGRLEIRQRLQKKTERLHLVFSFEWRGTGASEKQAARGVGRTPMRPYRTVHRPPRPLP